MSRPSLSSSVYLITVLYLAVSENFVHKVLMLKNNRHKIVWVAHNSNLGAQRPKDAFWLEKGLKVSFTLEETQRYEAKRNLVWLCDGRICNTT
jgi:hypothetical protein